MQSKTLKAGLFRRWKSLELLLAAFLLCVNAKLRNHKKRCFLQCLRGLGVSIRVPGFVRFAPGFVCNQQCKAHVLESEGEVSV